MTQRQTAAAVHTARGASYIFLQGIATNLLMAITFAIIARVKATRPGRPAKLFPTK